MKEPVWIRKDVVMAIHARQVAEHGGISGIRDEGLLDSALQRPQNLFVYQTNPIPSLADFAAAYAFGIAKNHPFLDGNKRTAFILCRLFLKLNGQDLVASSIDKYDTFIKLASGLLSERELSEWIQSHLAYF